MVSGVHETELGWRRNARDQGVGHVEYIGCHCNIPHSKTLARTPVREEPIGQGSVVSSQHSGWGVATCCEHLSKGRFGLLLATKTGLTYRPPVARLHSLKLLLQ